ncbi:MAG TPA: hypothetical protein VFT45_13380 [Longimicrobium sp.]|nr:hypothetical protein [Longimicrobium sp.]
MRIHRSPRRCVAAGALLLLAGAAPAAAAQSLAENGRCDSTDPRRVTVADGHVSLVLPEGLGRATDEMVARRFGTGPFPELVVSNDTALIFVRFVDEVARVDSPDYQAMRVRVVETVAPGFGQWVAREVVEQGGTRWLVHEYTASTGGATEHHRRYLTAYQGRTLEAVFVNRVPHGDWGAEMDYAAASLDVRGCAVGPALAVQPPPVGSPRPDAGLATAVCEEEALRARLRVREPGRWSWLDGRLSLVPPQALGSPAAGEIVRGREGPGSITAASDSTSVTMQVLDGVAMPDSASFRRDWLRRVGGRSSHEVRWISHGPVELDGTPWLRMVLRSRVSQGETYQVIQVASFRGRTVAVTLVGRAGQEDAIDQAAATLELRDCEVTRPLDAWVDSAGLALAAAGLPQPALPAGMKPLFHVWFDTTGVAESVQPVYDRIPADYAAAAIAAIRANLKALAPWGDRRRYLVRVAGGPAPVVDVPEMTIRAPQPTNLEWVQRRLGDVAQSLTYRPGARRLAAPRIYVELLVTASGEIDPGSIQLLEPTGVAAVDDPVRSIVRRIRFRPGEIDGYPADAWVRFPIDFPF